MTDQIPPPKPVLPVNAPLPGDPRNDAPSAGDIEHAATAAPAPAAPQAPQQSRLQQLSQEPWVQNLLPMITSVALHVGIFVFGWATYEPTDQLARQSEVQILVPDAAIVEAEDLGPLPNPGVGEDPTRAAAQDQFPDAANSNGWAQTPSQTVQVALMGGGGEEENPDTLIGLGSAENLSRGIGTGSGLGIGPGEGASGQLAPFGVPGGGGGAAPRADFMGLSGNARRVVFVCDATGTMLGLKHKLLQNELNKAINRLLPIQAFNLIFFRGGDTEKEWSNPFANGLLLANAGNKAKAQEFVTGFQVIGKGTNPLPALRLAFEQEPQLIYFLSDGQFDNIVSYQQVIDEIKQMNGGNLVRINTIAFMSEDEQAETALRTIAQQNGGQFVKVTEADLR